MCFPSIPIGLPVISNFSAASGMNPRKQKLNATIYGKEVVYYNWCHASLMGNVKSATNAIQRTLNIDPSSVVGVAIGRLIEHPFGAYSSIQNLQRAGAANESSVRLMATVCAISRLDAVMFTACFILLLCTVYLTCFWPCMLLSISFIENFLCVCLKNASRARRRKYQRVANDVD